MLLLVVDTDQCVDRGRDVLELNSHVCAPGPPHQLALRLPPNSQHYDQGITAPRA